MLHPFAQADRLAVACNLTLFIGHLSATGRRRSCPPRFARTSREWKRMVTAQDQLRALLREDIAPRLRRAGLTGTERTFRVSSREFFAQIGIQSSTSSTAGRVKFTANIQVIGKAAWNAARSEMEWLPARPSPNVIYPVSSWQERVGTLMSGSDRWWWLDANGQGRGKVVAELGDALVFRAVPAIHSQMKSNA